MKSAAVLDIGSSKIVCLCGSPVKPDGIVVHGTAVCPYAGYRDGAFEDEKSLRSAVIEAIQKAEQESRSRILEVAVAVPAPFAHLAMTEARVPSTGKNRRVTAEDVDDLIAESVKKVSAPGYVLMHSTPVSFRVNGMLSGEVPVGARADEISGYVSHMYVQESFVELLEDVLAAIHVEISMCISAQLAAALLIIPERERVRPAILIDVGYTHTDVALIENAALIRTATVEMGGMQFASDLSFGLDVPLEAAEQVKRRYVFGQEALSGTEIVRMPTGTKRVDSGAIEYIIEARANDLAQTLRQTLRQLGINPEANPVTYLTGGGFGMMKGGGEYLRRALQLPIKRDMPYMPEMNSPNYTSAFGALDFVLKASGDDVEPVEAPEASIVDKIRDIFKK